MELAVWNLKTLLEAWRKKLALFFALLVLGASLGCVAIPNGALSPGPVAELPASLRFPDSISVNVSEVSPAGGAMTFFKTLSASAAKAVVLPIGGEFFEAITYGFTITQFTNDIVAGVLHDLHTLEIPFNPVTRFFEASGTLPDTFPGAAIKIDFSDYDFDGNGTTKGCTGCTCPTGCDAPCPTEALVADLKPVCYRIWIDRDGNGEFVRFMAGFFAQIPIDDDPSTSVNEENPGSGSYRTTLQLGEFVANFGSNYDHRDPASVFHLVTEYFYSLISDNGVVPVDATNNFVKTEQESVPGTDSEEHLLKTIRESINQERFDDPTFTSTLQYIARFRTDADFWSGTFQNNLLFPNLALVVPPDVENFTDACAVLSTAIGVNTAACVDLGIDVANIPTLDLLTHTDPRVNIPADFPATPTF